MTVNFQVKNRENPLPLSVFEREWAEMDSNHRRRKPADLQSAPFGHFGIYPFSVGRWLYAGRHAAQGFRCKNLAALPCFIPD